MLSAFAAGRRRWAFALAPLAAIVLAFLAGGGLPLLPAPGDAPAAEAWGREFARHAYATGNASNVSDDALGDVPPNTGAPDGARDLQRCTVEVDLSSGWRMGQGRGIQRDWHCFSYTDEAYVTLKLADDNGDGARRPYRAFVSAGRPVSEADAYHNNVQTQDVERTDRDGNVLPPRDKGRAGLAEYRGIFSDDPADTDPSDGTSHTRRINLDRRMASPATNNDTQYFPGFSNGSVYLTVYTGNWGEPLSELDNRLTDDGLADLQQGFDVVIRVVFLQEIDPMNTWVFFPGTYQRDDGTRVYTGLPEPRGLGNHWRGGAPTHWMEITGNFSPRRNSITDRPSFDRKLIFNDYYLIDDLPEIRQSWIPTPTTTEGIRYCIHLRDYANSHYWHPDAKATVRLVFAPGSNLAGARGSYEQEIDIPWSDALGGGCNLTWYHLSGFNPAGPMRAELRITVDDGRGNADSTGEVEPIHLIIEGPPASLRLTRVPATRLNGGIRYVEMRYALADALGNPLTASRDRITWQGADDRSRAVIDYHGAGGASGGRFMFPIKADAPAGSYALTLTAGDISRNVPFTVPPLPRALSEMAPAGITASAVTGAAGAVFTGGARVNFRYTLQDADGNLLPLSAHPVTWSVNATGIIAPDGNTDNARQTDGRFGFDLAANPAPGEYTVSISTVANGDDGNPLASATVTFRIIGNPADYAVAGPDQIAPGGYAVYTVTATDANGNLPNLAGGYGSVAVAASGAGADAVRLFHIYDGSLTLNREGVGRFRLRADRGAMPGSVTITVAGPGGAVTGTRTVAIGAAP